MAGMGDLVQQDEYPSVDWSKYNQPTSEMRDPIAYRTPYFNVSRATVDNADRLWDSVARLPAVMGAILGVRSQR